VKANGVAIAEAIAQLSFDPLSTIAEVTLPVPAASKFTVKLLQRAFGAVLSTTVTVEVQVDIRPLLSVTVNVTVFGPTFAQVKAKGEAIAEAIPQLSKEPLFTAAEVTEAFPNASKLTVKF
jgi:hypothetical protein